LILLAQTLQVKRDDRVPTLAGRLIGVTISGHH